jgi:hypothetical protein
MVDAGKPFRYKLAELRHELRVPIDFSAKLVKVRLLVGGNEAWQLTINMPGDSIRAGDVSFPLPSTPWPRPHLMMFLDGSVIESFIGGREVVTSRVYTLKPGETEIEVSLTGSGKLTLDLWPLNAISPDRLTT